MPPRPGQACRDRQHDLAIVVVVAFQNDNDRTLLGVVARGTGRWFPDKVASVFG